MKVFFLPRELVYFFLSPVCKDADMFHGILLVDFHITYMTRFAQVMNFVYAVLMIVRQSSLLFHIHKAGTRGVYQGHKPDIWCNVYMYML